MHPDVRSARHVQHFVYRPAVDGLRGIAVLAVLGFHAFSEYVPGGYVGVDVFFVVSGFLITDIIARQLQSNRFSFADFYARRIRRLFPSLILVLGATALAGWFALMPDELELLGKHIAAAAMFAANIAFWREAGYFDVDAHLKPLLHLWSLGIEEQFYFFWPAVLVMLWRRRSLLRIVLASLVVGSLVLSIVLTSIDKVAAFFLPFTRFWELGLGCMLALWKARPVSSAAHPTFWNVVPAVGLGLIVATFFLFHANTAFPGWLALLPTGGTFLILLTPDDAGFQRRVLATPALVYVGLISYALYLWHWPLLSFANILQAGPLPYSVRWSALALGFALAVLTYHFVEFPIRRRKQLKVNVALVTGAAAAGLAGLTLFASAGVPGRFDAEVQALEHDPRVDAVCDARIDKDPRINYCRATSDKPPDIVILGDSRAQAVYEGIVPMFGSRQSVMLLARGGCPPLLDVRVQGYDRNEQDCDQVWRTFVDYLQTTKPKVVILVGNGSFLLSRPEIHLKDVGAGAPEPKEKVYEHGMRRLMGELSRFSNVIHLSEIPGFDSAPSCFLRKVRLWTADCSPSVSRDKVEAEMSAYIEILQRLQATLPNVRFVNSLPTLCSPTECAQWPSGGPLLYSDEIHLSPAGGRYLARMSGLNEAISERIRLARSQE